MFLKTVAKVGLAALLLGGCGGPVEMEAPEALNQSEQALLWACTGSNTWTRYWRNTSGVEVGREDCECDGTVYSHGTTSGRYSQTAGYSCR